MKEHIGDGIYVEVDPFECVVLTTSDGIKETNRIVFEPDVLGAFIDYCGRRDK